MTVLPTCTFERVGRSYAHVPGRRGRLRLELNDTLKFLQGVDEGYVHTLPKYRNRGLERDWRHRPTSSTSNSTPIFQAAVKEPAECVEKLRFFQFRLFQSFNLYVSRTIKVRRTSNF